MPTFAGSPASAAVEDPVLFEWDAPDPGARPTGDPVTDADDQPPSPDEMAGAQALPLDLPDAPARTAGQPLVLYRAAPRGTADRWVDAGLALLLRDRDRAGGARGRAGDARGGPVDGNGLAGGGPVVGERSARPSMRRGAAHSSGQDTVATPAHDGLRHPATGLASALALGLLAAFFGWVSAAPFWLANGVGTTGTATVVRCQEQTFGDRCSARFVAADGAFIRTVRLADLDPSDRAPGSTVRARVLTSGDVAYAGPVAGLHLRWILGFAAVLACGIGTGAATGVQRLRRAGPRKVAMLWALSLGGPAALALITLVAAL
ncbi:hypothetical protein SAMN05443668_11576 [Cryptosporangium aurantiacum]|uniref:Uncharacterized protein n=1 Tax=Cryptosporangium aurantiacum TaxID=134849 RepID=A0A1M7RJP7_9ACTN|nr:hypothetical protein SAMN05443668_11576 [Cryptosporangium aurantiacum]